MSFASRFEELEIWPAGQDFAVEIYSHFGVDGSSVREFSFMGQIRSAVVSISNNIAEGFECATPKEFNRFLIIAKRSCGEVRSMLWLAPRLGYMSVDQAAKYRAKAELLSKRIAAFARTLGV